MQAVSRETLADTGCANRRRYHSPAREHRVTLTKDALVEAVITLAGQGHYRATAKQIAAVAEVHVRSVYRHFGSAELLYRDVARRHWERVAVEIGTGDERSLKALVWAILVGTPRDLS